MSIHFISIFAYKLRLKTVLSFWLIDDEKIDYYFGFVVSSFLFLIYF
ncbi:hypothetical protein QE422_001985 [Chryseobacterium sp. SORGH_AS 447]|nr:hypothetical protein [Chryseobacterium sp. SORGH_AS_0447]